MRNERKRYTEDFKREAVRLMESSGKPISEIARDLGINDNNLYRWRGQYGRQEGGKAMGSSGNIRGMEAELKQLRREVDPRNLVPFPSQKQKFGIPILIQKHPDKAQLREAILSMRQQGMSYRKIGRNLSIDASRVWQIVTEALWNNWNSQD